MKKKIRYRKVLTGLLALCTVFHLGVVDVRAAQTADAGDSGYSYTIILHAGNQGTFGGNPESYVASLTSGAVDTVASTSEKIVIKGVKYDGQVTFSDAQLLPSGDTGVSPGVDLAGNSDKYYIKGIRQAGRDNSTVDTMSINDVSGDLEYVIAYGIQGDMTSYTVHYQNEAGSTLSPSRTFRGNVGDRPVVAYRYIEGYVPQAYNITRTLVKNDAENVFTFIYTPAGAGGGGGGGAAEEEGGTAAAAPAETAPEGAPAAAGAPAAPAAGAGAGDGGAAADEGAAPVEIPDDAVPQGGDAPQDLQEAGDEQVPLAEPGDELRAMGQRNLMGAVTIAGAGSLALIALIVLWVKRRRMQVAAAEDDDEE